MGRLADTIYGVPPSAAEGSPCKVIEVLQSLEGEDRMDLEAFLDSKLGGRRIAFALSQIGVQLSGTSVNDHRSKICRCYRGIQNDGG